MRSVQQLRFVEVLDPKGRAVFFEDLWSERVTVLALVRHFGCLFCHEQVADLLDARPELEAQGVQLRILGNGNPIHAQEFMGRMGLTEGVYTDPARLVYDGLGMLFGVGRTLNLRSTLNARRALRNGFRQHGLRGTNWQQGGCLIIRPSGDVTYHFRSEVAGHHPDPADLLDTLKRTVSG